ncbi:hypothetical protein N1028_18735 [Herbiconiux sp. CPCC 203407]|uniref:Uncharacterized protein n=1 Tax=Herbiconiux oxytropis TaxID=2970915 RepID=A0AA42BWD7_9MICO|nr:hypothetical protein [Herbiconiux oxytropis]MCS5723414.1 hypothetical protein [Herbiconiux oxytropis]MCS5727939.1 hypothetical protein [Herbiconiux oxytropis]
MRTEPPTGDEFARLLGRISQNVLQNAEDPVVLPQAVSVPKRRFRWGAVVVAVLIVLGLGTAGGAVALSLGFLGAGSGERAPMVSAPPTSSPTPEPTAPATTAPPTPETPTVSVGDAVFSPGDWGAGVTADLSGLTPHTQYALSIDSRYRGEAGADAPDAYFSVFSSPAFVTTDQNGAASLTWTPDVFPQNFTESGESGYLLGSYVRVDAGDGPLFDDSIAGFADPLVLSEPLPIEFLFIASVTVTAPACVDPEQLVSGQPGLPVTFSGLQPGELVFVRGIQSPGSPGFTFGGFGRADGEGTATVAVNGNSAMYPVASSADIAPDAWRLEWSASYRQTPTEESPVGTLPLTVGGC